MAEVRRPLNIIPPRQDGDPIDGSDEIGFLFDDVTGQAIGIYAQNQSIDTLRVVLTHGGRIFSRTLLPGATRTVRLPVGGRIRERVILPSIHPIDGRQRPERRLIPFESLSCERIYAQPRSASPTVLSVTNTAFNTDSTTHNCNLPATVDLNDGLLVFFAFANGDFSENLCTPPSGFTERFDDQWDVSGARQGLFVGVKVATGTEDGGTANVVTQQAVAGASQVYRLDAGTWGETTTSVEVSAKVQVEDQTNADPPNHTPSGGSLDYLWLAVAVIQEETTASAAPTNYTNLTTNTGAASEAVGLSTARRGLTASSENPGTFTSVMEHWMAVTVSVEPATATTTTIGKDNVLVWDIRAALGDPAQFIWDDRSAVGDPLGTVWGVAAVLGDSAQMIWDSRAAVGDSLGLEWDIAAAVGDLTQLVWDTHSVVGDSIGVVWDMGVTFGDFLGLVWDTPAIAGDSVQLVWDTRAVAGDSAQLVWDTRFTSGDEISLVWDVIFIVGDDIILPWVVSALASNSMASVWDTQTVVGDQTGLLWGTEETVGRDLSVPWDLMGIAGEDLDLFWDVQIVGVAGKQTQLSWDVLTSVGDQFEALWGVGVSVGDTVSLVWGLDETIGENVALTWDLDAGVGDDALIEWGVLTSVGEDTQFFWDLFTSIGQPIGLLWDQDSQVSKSVELLWDTEVLFIFSGFSSDLYFLRAFDVLLGVDPVLSTNLVLEGAFDVLLGVDPVLSTNLVLEGAFNVVVQFVPNRRQFMVGETIKLRVRVALPGTKVPVDPDSVMLEDLWHEDTSPGVFIPVAFIKDAIGDYSRVVDTTGFVPGVWNLIVHLNQNIERSIATDRFVLESVVP